MLEATKVSSTGHLYFIPRQYMDKVDTFETFIEQLSAMNQNDNGSASTASISLTTPSSAIK